MYDEEENEEMGNSSPSPFDRHRRGMRPRLDDREESPFSRGRPSRGRPQPWGDDEDTDFPPRHRGMQRGRPGRNPYEEREEYDPRSRFQNNRGFNPRHDDPDPRNPWDTAREEDPASDETDIRENTVVPMSKPNKTKEVEQKEMKKSIGLYAKLVRALGGEM